MESTAQHTFRASATRLPDLVIGSDWSRHPMPGQLQFPVFASPTDTSHAHGCRCNDCNAAVGRRYGRTL